LGDNIIELNGSAAANGGLYVKDSTNPNTATGSIIWDSTNDYWKAGVKDAESKVLLAGGDGVVSGSSQINFTQLSGISANIISSSSDTSNVDMIITGGSISANLKGGVVSGSSQITISDTTGYSTFSSSIATNVVELFGTASNHESRIDVIEASVGGGGSVATRIDQLAAATASVNSFTASATIRLNNLESTSASVNSRLDQLSTEELNVVPKDDVNVSILLNLLFCAVFVVLLEPVYVFISTICPLTDADQVLISEICPSTDAV